MLFCFFEKHTKNVITSKVKAKTNFSHNFKDILFA